MAEPEADIDQLLMRPIVKVENLGKRYRIGKREAYRTIRESIMRAFAAPWRGLRGRLAGQAAGVDANQVWALRDVNFEVMPGTVLGVIGRNGAGKSTLLKVLSRITEPTTGRVELYGRVGSLLEVGTGFHQELSGRDNVFLSGAIMGMRRAEIARKFDQIIAFAQIEDFVDTPVKRYSSGMYVRLAFAVAAHLDPEILLVDEVLAVGDVAFQKKCLGKIGEIARGGRTVLFVSHNMAAIESLCGDCLMFSRGRLAARGEPHRIMAHYFMSEIEPRADAYDLREHPGRRLGSVPTMTHVEFRSEQGMPSGTVRINAPMAVYVRYAAQRPLRPVLGIVIKTIYGAPVFCVSDRFCDQLVSCDPAIRATVVCTIARIPLLPGTYMIDLWLGDAGDDFDVIFDAISFEVLPADVTGTGRLPPPDHGPVFCEAQWQLFEE
jgi:lipopolysaccharide transport system ATP-binding protein